MKMIITAAAIVAMSVGAVHARPATCELTVNGKTWIDGPCNFETRGDNDGSFAVYSDNGSFAYAGKEGDQMKGFWNGEFRESHAHEDLGMLDRDGACWVNETARLCAW